MAHVPPPVPLEETQRLAALHEYDLFGTESDLALDNLTRLAAIMADAPIALISLADSDRQWFKSRVGLDVIETPRDVSFCGHAILDDDIFIVPDAAADERFAENPLVTGDPKIRFYAGAPLITQGGLRLGTVCVIDRVPRPGLTDNEAEGLRALASTVVDEFELRLLNRKLRAREEEVLHYQAVVAASTEFIAQASADGRLRSINPAGRRMVGIRAGDAIGDTTLSTFMAPEVDEMLWATAIPVAKRVGAWRGETMMKRRDGSLFPVDQVVLCHRADDGSIAFLSTICRDMSERDEILRLRELQSMKDAFVSSVSHELRTPLTSIVMALALLSDEAIGEFDAETTHILRIAQANAERLIQLVDDVMDIERSTTGDSVLRIRRCMIAELVGPATAALEAHAIVAGVRLEIDDQTPPLLAFNCDPSRIIRVLVNLLTNAIKFSGIGGDVTLRASAVDPTEVVFEVIDNGIGIRADAIDRIFEPFWQVDSSSARAVQGSGLGLAISKSIVERHGGTITVTSEFGKGSSFRVALPID